MDFSTLKAQIDAARQLEAQEEGATFTLKVPSDHAWRVALQAHVNEEGRVQEAAAFRAVLEAAIAGWAAVTPAHFGMEGSEPVAFSAAARSELLESRPDLAQNLILAIVKRRAERQAQLEAARKN